MITLKFEDKEVTQSNPKSARAYLRKNGMNVRQCTKNGEVWAFPFPFPLGDKVNYVPRPKPQTAQTRPKPQTVQTRKPKRNAPIYNLPVKGSDLLPGDMLVNFIDLVDLTLDNRGVHEIVIEAPNITRTENRFFGFHSVESGGLLSYRIVPDATYDVKR